MQLFNMTPEIRFASSWITGLAVALLLWHFVMVRTLHMFQLSSYQNMSYRNWIKKNPAECFGPRRLLPAAMLALGTAAGWWWMGLLALGLFLLVNRYPRAKKPLVWTARVKRLYCASAVLSGLAFVAPCMLWVHRWYYLYSRFCSFQPSAAPAMFPAAPYFVLAFFPALGVALTPALIMVWNAVTSPAEKAVSNRYIKQARDILRAHTGLTVIGITGSYGKTSTKYFLNELLSVKYNTYITPGNYNTTLGVVRAVREGLRPTHEVFICEMGARHPGDIKEICQLVRPQYGVLTYIGQQHMETFGSQEAITATKLELAEALEEDGLIFVNMDSPVAAAQRYRGMKLGYGTAPGCDYRACDISVGQDGSAFTLHAPDGSSQAFGTRLLGAANVQNLCGAIAVAHQLGVPLAQMAAPVRALRGVPHRLELKRAGDMTIIDDAYNSNPQGAAVALETLAMCSGSRICVTPGLVELGGQEAQFNRQVGQKAAACCDYLVTVGKNQGGDVAQGAEDAGMPAEKLYRAANINDALAHVRSLPMADKIVLLLNDLPDNYG